MFAHTLIHIYIYTHTYLYTNTYIHIYIYTYIDYAYIYTGCITNRDRRFQCSANAEAASTGYQNTFFNFSMNQSDVHIFNKKLSMTVQAASICYRTSHFDVEHICKHSRIFCACFEICAQASVAGFLYTFTHVSSNKHIHTYIHTYIYTYIHTHTRTHTHTGGKHRLSD